MTHSPANDGAGNPDAGLFCIVLAAGSSRRFGSPKQLASFEGQPLVVRAVRLAEESFGQRSLLVAGSEWRRVADACEPLAGFLVVNEEFDSGLGGSIAAGVGAIADVATGVLLLLADQPLIDTDYLRSMIDNWIRSPAHIVASEHDEVLGPPVIFPSRYFDALMELNGDRGAQQILLNPASPVIRMRCDSAAFDIDVPRDIESLREKGDGSG